MLPASQIVEFLESSKAELEDSSTLTDQVERIVESGNVPTKYRIRNIKIRLVIYFSPKKLVRKTSLEFDEPRYIICGGYIQGNFDYNNKESYSIGKSVHRIFDLWDKERKQITGYKEKLLRRQSYKCNNCNLSFNKECPSYINKDEYKPVFQHEELTKPEVDHKDPVWALGHNRISNAQVLCRFCNQGKGKGVETRIATEMQHSNKEIAMINWKYRAKEFYLAINGKNECSLCNNKTVELTVRPKRNDGCYFRANLEPVCVNCAY